MLRSATLLATGLLAASAFAGAPSNLDQVVAAQGLERVKARAFDVAYMRPGATLARYDRVLLEPVDVAFRPDWNPYRTGSRLHLTADEREQLRVAVTGWVQRAFGEQLRQGGLKPTDQPGPGVLRVKAHVVDLYLADSGIPDFGRSRVLTTSSGEATLVAEISDATTGEVLARVGDWEELRSTVHVLRSSNPTRIVADVESVAGNWGRTVREFVAATAAAPAPERSTAQP